VKTIKLNKIHNGDAFEILCTFPNESINCCVTSPPYYGLRDYGIEGQIGLEQSPCEYIKALVNVFMEVKRVLRKDGTLWLNVGDTYCGTGSKGNYRDPKYKDGRNGQVIAVNNQLIGYKKKDLIGVPWALAFALRDSGWYLRQDIIWEKGNAMPESVRDRCTKSHEYIFLLSKSRKYYFDYETIKEPCINGDSSSPRGSKGTHRSNSGRRGSGNTERKQRPSHDVLNIGNQAGSIPWKYKEFRNKRSVWSVNTKPLREAHFAVFPPDLITPCILAGCPEGGVVLDPFFGSGTTGLVAKQYKRNYVGIDLNQEYCELAARRIGG